jgi:hypothetical protein
MEEGGFIRAIVIRYLKADPTQAQMNVITYTIRGPVWLLSWGHLALIRAAD